MILSAAELGLHLSFTTAGNGVDERVAAAKYFITQMPPAPRFRGDGARTSCYGGNGM